MVHADARMGGKWRGNWRMELLASTLHTTSEHGVSSITIADLHTSTASSRLNWLPRRFKWTRPFRRKRNLVFARVPSHFNWPVLVYNMAEPCHFWPMQRPFRSLDPLPNRSVAESLLLMWRHQELVVSESRRRGWVTLPRFVLLFREETRIASSRPWLLPSESLPN